MNRNNVDVGTVRAHLAFCGLLAVGGSLYLSRSLGWESGVYAGLLAFYGFYIWHKLSGLVRGVGEGAGDLVQASRKMYKASEEFSINSNRQEVNAKYIAALLGEVNQVIESTAENAKASASFSDKSSGVAGKGKEAVEELISFMEELSKSNGEIMQQIQDGNQEVAGITQVIHSIGEKTKVINEIVFQTKLLSFNASVEAARAGEHGKGFAVVAEEVGRLAKMSGESADTISKMLAECVQQVEQTIRSSALKVQGLAAHGKEQVEHAEQMARRCGQAFDDVVENVLNNTAEVKARIEQISTSCQEQSKSVQDISSAMSQLEEISNQNSVSAQTAIANAEDLTLKSDLLDRELRGVQARILGGTSSQGGDATKNLKGVRRDAIVLGMANALSGNATALGTGMKTGAEAFFSALNRAGGVHSRKVELLSLDDGYEPERTKQQTTTLLNSKNAFSLFGYVGTPTSSAALPLAEADDCPFFAPFTGARSLRIPLNRNVFHVRASYFDEAERMVEYIVQNLGLKKVGLFIQDDGYGAAGEAGVLRALAKVGLKLSGKGIYRRNTVDVDMSLKTLQNAACEAVIMVGTYKACAAFVKKAKQSHFCPSFFNLSFVGTSAFISESGKEGEGVYITQVVPSPYDASVEIVRRYQEHMKAFGHAQFDYTSLEGYIAATVFAEALKKAKKDLSRASLRKGLEGLDLDLGGFKVAFSPESHSGSSRVWLTQVQNGMPVTIQDSPAEFAKFKRAA